MQFGLKASGGDYTVDFHQFLNQVSMSILTGSTLPLRLGFTNKRSIKWSQNLPKLKFGLISSLLTVYELCGICLRQYDYIFKHETIGNGVRPYFLTDIKYQTLL